MDTVFYVYGTSPEAPEGRSSSNCNLCKEFKIIFDISWWLQFTVRVVVYCGHHVEYIMADYVTAPRTRST